MVKCVSILGSTGSIGRQSLDVISRLEGIRVAALTAGSGVEKMAEQCRRFRPRLAVMATQAAADRLGCPAAAMSFDTHPSALLSASPSPLPSSVRRAEAVTVTPSSPGRMSRSAIRSPPFTPSHRRGNSFNPIFYTKPGKRTSANSARRRPARGRAGQIVNFSRRFPSSSGSGGKSMLYY